MSCDRESSIAVVHTSSRRLKDGKLRYFKDKLFSKWPHVHAVLYEDSTLCWFDDERNTSPVGSLRLLPLAPYMAVGAFTEQMPIKRPRLPHDGSVHHLIAIGTGPRCQKLFWFLVRSDDELTSWMSQIVKTLPPPPTAPPMTDTGAQSASPGPPPPYHQPPLSAYHAQPGPSYQQQQAAYPPYAPYQQQPAAYPPHPPYQQAYYGAVQRGQPQTTVVVQQQRGGYGGGWGGGGGGFGTGMLLGGVMGYGLGSAWGHGWGGHHGGGFYQDNDTNVVNNYYGDDGQQADDADDYGGGDDFGDGDFGSGDDFGDGDF